jgi:NarL family two-component system sensor histidine kinase LiaS
MRRILSPFRTLSWKLTLSYTLVTVAALLVAEFVLLGIVLVFILKSDIIPSLAAQTMVGTAPQLVPYLDEATPDLNGLNSWLLDTAVNGFIYTNPDYRRISYSPGPFSRGDGQIAVLDSHNNLLAITPQKDNTAFGKPFDTTGTPELAPLLEIALSGESDYRRLYILTPEKKLVVAAPIQTPDNKVLGVLVYAGTFIEIEQSYGQLPYLLGGSLLLFTCAAGGVGTVFGLITARGLTRRLRTVSRAADSWSRGDFSAVIPDSSGDELGQLANRLNRMSEHVQTLMHARQELATLEERNRLARDLHDSVKQQVFATVMQVGAARELLAQNSTTTDGRLSAAEDHLAEAERLARLAQQELAVLIRELRPVTLEGKGLANALREALTDWSKQTGIAVDFRIQGERILPLASEQALYRVAQEALANVTRHSRATAVEVHLACEGDHVTLTITDNGHGFDPTAVAAAEAAGEGMGLQSMRERMEEIGGKLIVESDETGTKITADTPI